MSAGRQLPRWPLFLIAAPAAVAVWSGWVGLGGMCGFGVIHPLPGIWDGLRLDTAITLPVGVEAYGAYALGAWLTPGTPTRARSFARRSAIGALALGMLGQVVYHLLAGAGAQRAPWPVVVLVSCLPVVTLGFGAALTHLLRGTEAMSVLTDFEGVPAGVPADVPVPVPAHAAVPAAVPVPAGVPDVPGVPERAEVPAVPAPAAVPASGNGLNGHGHEAEQMFAATLAAGLVPPIRLIRERMHVGGPRAKQIQAHLETRTPAGQSIARARAEMRQHADEMRQGAEVAITP